MASEYSPAQIDDYLRYISIPEKYHRAANPPLDLAFLTTLHIHQISAVPYENLILHYSQDHSVSLEPQSLYRKIVTNGRGRGGYCMEISIFFNHVLRALGFQVYTSGVRIRPRLNGVPSGNYIGWVHIVNIVTLADGSKYMLDVAFGGDGPTKPLPLIHGHAEQNLGTQELRLLYDNIEQQVDKSKKLWIFQYRNGAGLKWNSFYCFPDVEFLHDDFEIMNYFTSTSQGAVNHQTRTVLAVKFLRGERGEGIVGKVMLVDGDVKVNTGGKTHLVKTCGTEKERVEALKEHFGIKLIKEEIDGIRGQNMELSQN